MSDTVVCAGVSCLDLFLIDADPLLTRESLSLVSRVEYRPGGATSNTGRALARLGTPVEFLSVIGNDDHGAILRRFWEEDGIGFQHVIRSSDTGTALSVLPVYPDGKRGVYFSSGTNAIMGIDNLFGPGKEHLALLRHSAAFHYGYPPLTPCLQGTNLAEMLALVRNTGVLLSLDTTPVTSDGVLYKMLKDALPMVHLFAPNIEEASQVTGHFTRLAAKAHAESETHGYPVDIEDIITVTDLEMIGEALSDAGIPLIIITLGRQGAYVHIGSAASLTTLPHAPSITQDCAGLRCVIPAFEITGPINTTGAGDTFVAGLLTGITCGTGDITQIVRFAQAASALHVDTSRGLRDSNTVYAAINTLPLRTPTNKHLRMSS